ncbi:hypothetical protein GBAR_LOCUS24584, partial [Geodia barretti]
SPHIATEGLGRGPGILATLYHVLLFTWSISTVVVQLSILIHPPITTTWLQSDVLTTAGLERAVRICG